MGNKGASMVKSCLHIMQQRRELFMDGRDLLKKAHQSSKSLCQNTTYMILCACVYTRWGFVEYWVGGGGHTQREMTKGLTDRWCFSTRIVCYNSPPPPPPNNSLPNTQRWWSYKWLIVNSCSKWAYNTQKMSVWQEGLMWLWIKNSVFALCVWEQWPEWTGNCDSTNT